MSNKVSEEEVKEPSKIGSNKFDYELYHEEDDKVEKILRVKRVGTDSKEKWRIFENTVNTFTIDGIKLGKKERAFLRTVDGINYIIEQYKLGINSINQFKLNLKNKLAP